MSVLFPVAAVLSFSASLLYKKFGKEGVIYLIVFLFFVVTSDLNITVRVLLNYGSLALLGLLYLLEFGLSLKPIKKVPDIMLLLMGFTLFSMILSTLGSANIMKSADYLFKQIIFFGMIFILFAFTRNDKNIYAWIYVLIITSIVLSLSLLIDTINMLISASSMADLGVIRASGLYENANATGLFLVVAIPFILIMILKNKEDRRLFWAYTALFIISFLALMLTNSRASLMGTGVSIFYLLFQARKQFFYKLIYWGFGILIIILLIDPLRELFLTFIRYERIFENVRGYYWQIAIEIFKDNPVLGVGPHMFEENIYRYLPVKMNSFNEYSLWWARSGTAHNFLLYRLSEYGLIGLFNAGLFIYMILKFSGKILDHIEPTNKYRYIVLGIRGVTLGLLARSLFETTGLLSNGWITKDLPFWVALLIIMYIYNQVFKKKGFAYS